MTNTPFLFNYIITIHNKEKLIKDVISSVIDVAGPESYIYPVLDGCNDNTETIIDELMTANPLAKIKKLYANDVHELKSINIGLENSNQDLNGFNIILQDDVLLQDRDLEAKCVALYNSIEDLGIVSFRHGGNLSRKLIRKVSIIDPLVDYIENECGHNPYSPSVLKTGFFVFREIAIKSPICIPTKVVRRVGKPDESFAPWDDIAYCMKVSESGFRNGVFAIDFRSDVAWGTTREVKQVMKIETVIRKNLELFRQRNLIINKFDRKKYEHNKRKIFDSNKIYTFHFIVTLRKLYSSMAYSIKQKIKLYS